MRLRNNLVIGLILLSSITFSQDYFDEGDKPNEFSLGFNANTNGTLVSGFNFRYSYLREAKKFDLYSLEIVNVKHEKEERFSTSTSSSFILGKVNYLLAIRPSYGKEVTLFGKYPENGIRLNFTYSGGPTIGVVKPYMIEYPSSTNANLVTVVPYNPSIHSVQQIRGDAGILTGMEYAKLNIGAHLRSSLNFEYGPTPYLKMGLEAGSTLEAYLKPNIIMQNLEKRSVYSAFFVHLYYGFSF